MKKSNCYHKEGHEAHCSISNYPFMIIFAVIQIILSQIPNFHKLSWLSIIAAVMSFAYSTIGLGLSIAKVVGMYSSYDRLFVTREIYNRIRLFLDLRMNIMCSHENFRVLGKHKLYVCNHRNSEDNNLLICIIYLF